MNIQIFGDNLCAFASAAVLASVGHKIRLSLPVGSNRQAIVSGDVVYPEPRLQDLFQLQRSEGRLTLAEIHDPVAADTQAVFLSFFPNDYAQAEQVVKQIAMQQLPLVVINQSTFNIGTSEYFKSLLNSLQSLVYIPDFIQEGAAIESMSRPSQIILGNENSASQQQVKEIFRSFNRLKDVFLQMSLREAEFTKLAVSGMLATRISYMNDLANVADAMQIDIEQVRQGLGSDPRIGAAYLYAGCGFGGQSFSKDVISLARTVSGVGIKSKLIEQILQSNEDQKEILFRKLWQHFNCDLDGKVVAIWGAAYKPNTNQIDNAPILKLLEALWAQGVQVKLHDPEALPNIAQHYGNHPLLTLCDDQYDAATGVDALLLVTEWKQYWNPDFEQLKKAMRTPLILDGRNIYNPYYVKDSGFDYIGIGRGA